MLAHLQGVSDHGQLVVSSSNLGFLSDPHVSFPARCERSWVALVFVCWNAALSEPQLNIEFSKLTPLNRSELNAF